MNKDMGPIRIRTVDHNILVQVRGDGDTWTTVGMFHEISDDYAYTNALECAQHNLDNLKKASVVAHGMTIAPQTSVDNLSADSIIQTLNN